MNIALLLFTMFYTPKPVVPFYTPPIVIEQPIAPVLAAPVQLPQASIIPRVPATKQPEPVTTTPEEFYQYTCPEGQYPIGDGQCHINNDRPGDWEK